MGRERSLRQRQKRESILSHEGDGGGTRSRRDGLTQTILLSMDLVRHESKGRRGGMM